MKHIKTVAVWLMAVFYTAIANAELNIEITQGVDNPTTLAAVPFHWAGVSPLPEDIAKVVDADLYRSGQFKTLDRTKMLSLPYRAPKSFRDWRVLGQEYLLIGEVSGQPDGSYKVRYELFDVFKRGRVLAETITVGRNQLRAAAHRISDKIYEQLTGVRGAFSTRIMYVTANRGVDGKDRFELQVADADGYNPQTIFDSKQPVLSPDWSPDGKRVAYVSFKTGRPAIYIQDLRSGRQEQLTAFRGLNSAPSWSPDGKRMAMTLSKDGNPEIYVMELATRKLTRVTNHFGIDTEASWGADGQSLIFTSSRGGKPQIYQVNLATKAVKRLTFKGDYNARGRLSKDGRYLVMVHRRHGVFHIAVQDLKKQDLRVLTRTKLDESPSIAPNGSMLIYATNVRGKGILAAVSVDGRVKIQLPSSYGHVREPSWSPY